MTYANQEMMTQIDFEKVIVDTFVDKVFAENLPLIPDITIRPEAFDKVRRKRGLYFYQRGSGE